MPLTSFYSSPRKHQKTEVFLIFSEGIERDRGRKYLNEVNVVKICSKLTKIPEWQQWVDLDSSD